MKKLNSLMFVGLALICSSTLVHSSDEATDKTPSTAPIADDFLIVAGQGIGKVRLGDSQEKIHETLGAPSTVMLNGPRGYEVEGYKSGFSISYNDYKVVEIRITSKKYKTPEGVSVGSSPEAIRKLFTGGVLSPYKIHLGAAHGKNSKTLTFYTYTDAKRGIRFQFGNNQEHSTKWCDTITVMKLTA